MDDPYPNQLLLSQKEVLHVLGMSRNTFMEFLRDDEGANFPDPVSMGKERNGKPRFRWRKYEVLSFMLLKSKVKMRQTPSIHVKDEKRG